jgi:hypothetical protein
MKLEENSQRLLYRNNLAVKKARIQGFYRNEGKLRQ